MVLHYETYVAVQRYLDVYISQMENIGDKVMVANFSILDKRVKNDVHFCREENQILILNCIQKLDICLFILVIHLLFTFVI